MSMPPPPPPPTGGQPPAPPPPPRGPAPFGTPPLGGHVAPGIAPSAPTGGGVTLGHHAKRALDWNMNTVDVTPREREELIAAGVTGPRLQGLLAWRRSCLILAMPILIVTLALSIWETADTDTEFLTGLGTIALWLPPLGLALVPIGAYLAIKNWTEIRTTSNRLVAFWVVSIGLPLLVALMPLDILFDLDAVRATLLNAGASDEDVTLLLDGVRVNAAVSYALVLLPIIVTVPAGVLRGAVRVKTVFPAAALPGWFLVSVAPFYSLFMIVVFVLIEQIAGNLLLVLGVGLLAFAPWLFVIHRKVYARSMSNAEASVEMARAARPARLIVIAGAACIVIVAFTAKVGGRKVMGAEGDNPVFTYLDVGRTAIEIIGRSLITTVVFSLIFLSMVYNEWRNSQTMTFEIRREHEAEMGELQRFAEAQPDALQQ